MISVKIRDPEMALNIPSNGDSRRVRISPMNYVTAERKKARQGSLHKLFDSFMDYTSSHGFAHIKRVKNRPGKVIWAILTFAGIGVAVYQSYKVIEQYFRYDYNTLMDIKFDANITFPAVTICNLNPYRLSQVKRVVSFDKDLGRKYEAFTTANDSRNSFAQLNDLLQAVNQLSTSNKSLLGHQLEDMLVECFYGSRECNAANFTLSYNFVLGNCYTFNEYSSFITNRAGPRYGLKLVLFTEIHEYVPQVAGSTGFKVVVHNQNQVPFPEEEGFHVASGFKTLIGVRRFELQRLGHPYYNCHPSTTAGSLNLYNQTFRDSYSRSVCLRSCYQNALISHCGCYTDEIPYPEDMDTSILACSRNHSMEDCANSLYSTYFDDIEVDIDALCPDCYPVCTEVKYYGTFSQSMIPVPDDDYVTQYIQSMTRKSQSFQDWFEKLKEKNFSQATLDEKARYALAQVQIFFDELNYESVYQKLAATPTDVISNLGGQLGLWIGMSLLSVFEYFELVGRLLVFLTRRISKVDKTQQIPDIESQNTAM